MKRLSLIVIGLALLGGAAAGCSKAADVATPTVDANKISNDATKCAEMASAYATLYTPLANPTFTDADKTTITKSLDDMKGKVPDSVKKDLDTIANGIKNAKASTDVATFLGSTEYTTAHTNVTKYLTTECSKVGQ